MRDKILRPRQVSELTGKSISTLWRDQKNGVFPKSRKIGGRAVGWLSSEIDTWMEGLEND